MQRNKNRKQKWSHLNIWSEQVNDTWTPALFGNMPQFMPDDRIVVVFLKNYKWQKTMYLIFYRRRHFLNGGLWTERSSGSSAERPSAIWRFRQGRTGLNFHVHLLYTDYSSVRLGYHCVCLCVCFQHTVYFVLWCVSINGTNVTFMHTHVRYLYICVYLSVFAYSAHSCSCAMWVSSSEAECVINVLFGADRAGPGKLYGPRGGRLIMAVSLEPLCHWMTNNCKRHSTEKYTQEYTLTTLI